MRKAFRAVFIMVVLVVFLAGITGFSFSVHECGGSHTREVIPFPEILNKTVSCCCGGEVHGNLITREPALSFSEPECCRNTHVYLKASFTGFPVLSQFSPETPVIAIPVYFPVHLETRNLNHLSEFIPWVDHPPPRSGIGLICFIHQFKIPFPVSWSLS